MVLVNGRTVLGLLSLTAAVVFVMALISLAGKHANPKAWFDTRLQKFCSMHVSESHVSFAEFTAWAEFTWAKSVQQRHHRIIQDYGDASRMPAFPFHYEQSPYTIWDLVPASYSCPYNVERIGRLGDGGHWVCGMSKYTAFPKDRQCVIYSFGLRGDVSFEQEMLDRTGCEMWAYDFYMDAFGKQLEEANPDRVHFQLAGVGGETDTSLDPPMYTIEDLMAKNEHEYIDILKMDVEFYEFESLDALHKSIPLPGELPIGQLIIQIHFFNQIGPKEFLQWWERLEERGLRPTWSEPSLVAVTVNSSKKDPILADYTMINTEDSRSVLFHGR
ncbi:hypothetical protein CTRI78_v007899 [Colletotrichum trifolii]|uniref:Methyltransferase domain-containing protein n=1 Tax=Colletotrichum trifolii TaxID=5466 RepID=A0A4R8R8S2_COLTR|nr:hypothetical protein CTRI78_v007899 [Colletotrichum trifolii]